MNVVEVLTEARRKIAEVGWCKGNFVARDEEGKICAYCAYGAISWSIPLELSQPVRVGVSEGAIGKLKEVLRAEHGFDDYIAEWNDAEGRTKEEVIDLFDEALARALKENT